MTSIADVQGRLIALCKDIPLVQNAYASEANLATFPAVPAFIVRRGRSIRVGRQGKTLLMTREYLLLLYVAEVANDSYSEDETSRAAAAGWIPTVYQFFLDRPRLERPGALAGVTSAEITSDTGDVLMYVSRASRKYAGVAFRMQVTSLET